MSKKSKRRATEDTCEAPEPAPNLQPEAEEVEALVLAVGNTYHDAEGNAYAITSIKNEIVTAKRGGRNIPFQLAMFEELVGIGNPKVVAANTAKGAEKAAKSKAAAEKAVADKAAAEAKAKEEKAALKQAHKAASASNGGRRVSGMSVIRDTLAKNPSATVEQISDACKKAGVPKSDSTISTIMSDFKQTYKALEEAGRIRVLH